MKKNIAVQLRNVSKHYRLYNKPIDRLKESLHPLNKKYHKKFHALKNINLEIKKGEVLGIVGVNGAGKSTLLKIISGVLTPSSGTVNLSGKVNAILELTSGLKPEMTGLENIKLNLQLNGFNREQNHVMQEIVDFADIGEHIHQPVKTYSSGMKARLAFGIAISSDPDVLIVDEVLAVGDAIFKRKCYDRIQRLFNGGRTVIFVSHSTQSVIEFCTRAILLFNKEIVMDDTPKKVTDYYQKLLNIENKPHSADSIDNKVESNDSRLTRMGYNKDFYTNSLKVEPTIDHNENININNISIFDEDELVVNILTPGHSYKCRIEAQFKSGFSNVKFGCSFRNTKGVLIGGATHLDEQAFTVDVGETVLVEFLFKCIFLPGNFFLNINITRNATEGAKSLYAAWDVLCFKVQDTDSTIPVSKEVGVVSIIDGIETIQQ